MSHVRFDPSKAVSFDLSRGLVHLDGAPSQLLVPAAALSALVAAAGAEATRAFGRALGEAIGLRVARRLATAGGLREVSTDAMIEHLGGELSIAGFGSLSLEQWGRALVLVVDQSPLAEAGDALLEEVLGSALASPSASRAQAVFLGRDAARARFLIAGSAGVAKVRAWLAEGVPWGEALVRLHARSATAAAPPEGDAPALKSAGAPALSAAAPTEATAPPRGDA
jgi:hypothetical protein